MPPGVSPGGSSGLQTRLGKTHGFAVIGSV
jgi:hypothetical protein